MFKVETSIIIEATPQDIWDVLLNFEHYHQWSNILHYEGGIPALGDTIQLRLTPPQGASYSFQPKITEFEPPHAFAWIGITGIQGLFDGEHFFYIQDLGDGTSKLTNREEYSGLLSPIIRRLGVLDGAESGFQEMNQQIKQRVESQKA